ncbi:S8 family serine peptidase, partial [Micromonospora sp. NPDC003776]
MLPGPLAAPPPPPVSGPREGGPWPVVAAVFTGVWAVLVTVAGQVAGWVFDQAVLTAGRDRLVLLWPVIALATVLLVGAPVLALALLPRSPAVRTTGRVWLVATLALGAATLLRALPPVHQEAYLAALAAVAALLALLVGRRSRAEVAPADGGRAGVRRFDPVTLLAVAAGLAVLLPWVWVGALGGFLETVLAGLAAAAFGALAGVLLDAGFWDRFAVGEPARPARLVLVGGLVAGVALVLLAAGAGQSGAQLPGLFLLPPLGFVLGA